jgi:hypothetical protein
MSAQVISLFDYFESSRDWTQRELSEFYRVVRALILAGIQVETDRGVTDEGEPWFVFCRSDTGEAFIHFARVDGKYIAVGSALDQVVEGRDFAALVQEILAGQAWVMAKARNRSNVFLHPSALLIAIVGAAFFHSGEAKAAETTGHGRTEVRRHVLPILIGNFGDKAPPALDAAETAAIVSSVLIEWNQLTPISPSSRDVLSMVSAASAVELAASSSLAHGSATVSDLTVRTFAHDGDPAAPPQGVTPEQSSDAQGGGLTTLVTPTSMVAPEHPFADNVALDSTNGAIQPVDLSAAVAISATVLVATSTTDAAETIQSANILADLAFQSAPVAPSTTLMGLVDSGEQLKVGPTSAVPAHTPAAPPSAPAAVAGAPPNVPTATDGHAGAGQPANPTGLSPIDPHVAAAVSQFVGEVSVLDVAMSGHEIILYDGAIFKPLPPGTMLESMTFNFSDGSSISLVGTVAELQHLHLT